MKNIDIKERQPVTNKGPISALSRPVKYLRSGPEDLCQPHASVYANGLQLPTDEGKRHRLKVLAIHVRVRLCKWIQLPSMFHWICNQYRPHEKIKEVGSDLDRGKSKI